MGQDPQNEENYTPCPTKIYHVILNYWGLLIKNIIVVLKNSIQLPWKQHIEKGSLHKKYLYTKHFKNLFLALPFSKFLFANAKRVWIFISNLQ